MSSADGKWQLGCVVFEGGFQEYDRFTSLGSSVSAYASSISLNSTVATNYMADPMFLRGVIFKNGGTTDGVYGPEIILGPSSHATYSGSVEKIQPYGRNSSGDIINGTTIYLATGISQHHTARPSAAYASGDPVIVRTVPLGWSPGVAFESQNYAVMPIGRYEDRQSLYFLADNPSSNLPLITDYKKKDLGVRLINNSSTLDTDQYIKKSSDVNSFSSRIRCYRASWYYRVVKAHPGFLSPSGDPLLAIDIELQDAAGSPIVIGAGGSISTETGHGWAGGTSLMYRRSYTSASISTGAWVYDEAFLSPFKQSNCDTTDEGWYWIADSVSPAGLNPSNQAVNRGNRWGVELHIERGINTAFDVDDLIIEHAQDTSMEASGYYEIDDWPVTGSVTWDTRDAWSKNVLMNGSVRSVKTNNQAVPKHTVFVEYDNVDIGIYNDLAAIMNWQRKGYACCLRPFGYDELPPVMVGFLSLSRPASKSWSLNRVSFSMQFEEA